VGPKVLGMDIVAQIQGLPALMERLAASEVSKRVDSDMRANQDEFMQKIRERQNP